AVEQAVRVGLARGRSVSLVAENAHLPEHLTGVDAREDLLDPPRDRLGDDDAARLEEEQLLAGVTHPKEHVTLPQAPLAERVPQLAEDGLLDVMEEGNLAKERDLGQSLHQARPRSARCGHRARITSPIASA